MKDGWAVAAKKTKQAMLMHTGEKQCKYTSRTNSISEMERARCLYVSEDAEVLTAMLPRLKTVAPKVMVRKCKASKAATVNIN